MQATLDEANDRIENTERAAKSTRLTKAPIPIRLLLRN